MRRVAGVIILINGPINAGKTTVGRQLAAMLPQAAHVEVDSLREFVAFLPLAEAIPVSLENAAAVTRNLIRRGFHVVLTYPLGPEDYAYLQEQFSDLGTAVHAFTLSPSLAIALSDRGNRAISDHERRRIREQYADNLHQPSFGSTIDNSVQSPAETAAAILRTLGLVPNAQSQAGGRTGNPTTD
jgi:hypothetical protein